MEMNLHGMNENEREKKTDRNIPNFAALTWDVSDDATNCVWCSDLSPRTPFTLNPRYSGTGGPNELPANALEA